MENNWAAENLQTIRTLMERTALYRQAIAPISIVVGVIGILAAVAGQFFKIGYENQFLIPYWLAVAVVALIFSIIMSRRQAMTQGEALWSPPARRVAQAMFPGFAAGLVVGLIYFLATRSGVTFLPIFLAIIISTWAICYGLALHAASFFMPVHVRWFAWVFIILGLLIALEFLVLHWIPLKITGLVGFHGLMGIIFGLTHLIFGGCCLFTESKNKPL
jgi:hypothetical protein